MSSLLEVKDVSFSVGKKKILQDVSFSVERGEVMAVVGHNGAGKTSLFHLILGLRFQKTGTLLINGVPAAEPRSRKKVSFVPERPYLNPRDTLKEMLKFYGKLSGIAGIVLEQKIKSAVEVVNLVEIGGSDVLDRKLKTFSKGMLQRALIAQALLNDPEFLILDEPMSGLDPEGREWVRNLIQSLQKQGKTILFATHALEDAELLSTRILKLNQGQASVVKGAT